MGRAIMLYLALLSALSLSLPAAAELVSSCASEAIPASLASFRTVHSECIKCLSAASACPAGCCMKNMGKYRVICHTSTCCIAVIPIGGSEGNLAMYTPLTAASSTGNPDVCAKPVDAPASRCPQTRCAIQIDPNGNGLSCQTGWDVQSNLAGAVSNCVSISPAPAGKASPAATGKATAAPLTTKAEVITKAEVTTRAPAVVITVAETETREDEDEDATTGTTAGEASGTESGDKTSGLIETEASTCFPAGATVEVEGVGRVRMDALNVGDKVLCANGKFSEVFMFTHRCKSYAGANYVRIGAANGQVMTATVGHFVYMAGGSAKEPVAVPIEDVVVGAFVFYGDSLVRVVSVRRNVFERGLYNPHTLTGDIVVDGFLASTYTTAVEPTLAHALLAPFRGAFSALGLFTSVFESGAPRSVAPFLGEKA